MPTTNVIIDGHGAELTSNYSFQRAAVDASKLYSYVKQGIGIPINQSDKIISDIIQGNFNDSIATVQQSRIGGSLIHDKQLHAIGGTPAKPQWSNDHLFATGTHSSITINKIALDEFTLNNTVYLRLPVGSAQTVNLSDIINHYSSGQYNFFWTVCRAE